MNLSYSRLYPILGRPSCAIRHIAVMAQDRKRLDPLIPPFIFIKNVILAQFWREHLRGKVSNTESKYGSELVQIGLLPSWAEYGRKAGNVYFTLWWRRGRAFYPGSSAYICIPCAPSTVIAQTTHGAQHHYSRLLMPSGWCRTVNKLSPPTLSSCQVYSICLPVKSVVTSETSHVPSSQISLNLFWAIVNYDTHLCNTLFTNQFVIRKPL
jgi:hypothetical protein